MGTFAFEEVVNKITPIIIDIFSVIGITTLMGSVFIGIYRILKKQSWKSIMIYGSLFGFITWICSSVLSFIIHFDPFLSTKVQIPISIIIAFIVFILFTIYHSKTKNKKFD